MNNSTRMNMFLQRMLRKSDEELNAEVEDKTEIDIESPKGGFTKGGWMKKLSTYSPKKYKVPSSPLRSNDIRKNLDQHTGVPNNYVYRTPKNISGSPHSPLEMPDLESIIREFETGFLSPTKHEAPADPSKQKNFVKKIVAAFEVKYKAYNDLKTEHESKLFDEERKDRTNSEESQLNFTNSRNASPKRRSGIFNSPFKSQDESKSNEGKTRSPRKSSQTDSNVGERWSSVLFSSPSNITNSPRKSGLFSSPFNRSVYKETNEKSDVTPRWIERQETQSTETTIDDASFLRFEREDSIFASRKLEEFANPFALDETKSISSLDLDVTLPEPEETIRSSPNTFDSTRILTSNLSEAPFTPLKSSSVIDRTPKIVGAFLKKPIEVEDTSIDWIPITGKKLPRKKSLKKLLSVLTGKKSYVKKTQPLYSSERNLYEDSRELQDSGYDERSCSSSSLTSLVSINEALLHQENSYIEPERRVTLRTFRSQDSVTREEEEDEAFTETYCSRRGKKRLLLTEVPREEVKLDLGPTFPSSTRILTMSLDRRAHSKPKNRTPSPKSIQTLPKHPFSSQIPKHPFVSMTKMDEVEENDDTLDSPSVVIRNDLYEVEFRRSCNDIPIPASARSSISLESDYDVPRSFISKSESRIHDACARDNRKKKKDEPIYDVPRNRHLERPKSSLYEDALSLKRRTADLPANYAPGFYAFADEPHYATVKPRNKRIYMSQEMLASNHFNSYEKTSSF